MRRKTTPGRYARICGMAQEIAPSSPSLAKNDRFLYPWERIFRFSNHGRVDVASGLAISVPLGAIFVFSDPRGIDVAPGLTISVPQGASFRFSDPRGIDFAPGLAISLTLDRFSNFLPGDRFRVRPSDFVTSGRDFLIFFRGIEFAPGHAIPVTLGAIFGLSPRGLTSVPA